MVNLQCLDNFCCSTNRFSYAYAHIQIFFRFFSRIGITEHWVELKKKKNDTDKLFKNQKQTHKS